MSGGGRPRINSLALYTTNFKYFYYENLCPFTFIFLLNLTWILRCPRLSQGFPSSIVLNQKTSRAKDRTFKP